MASMDIFKADAFSTTSMLKAIENTDYKPQLLGSLELFADNPVSTRTVMVESRDNELSLIQTTPIGAPLPNHTPDKRKVRNFSTVRIAKQSRLYAEEIQGVRAFGEESELKQIQAIVARRLQRLIDDVELTHEFHRLGAVQGIVSDADSSTIVNFFTEFGVAQPDAVDFAFSALSAGEVRPLIEGSIVRPLIRAAKGAFTPSSRITALVGDDFWDEFVNHAEVRETYKNYQAAAELREGTVFSRFPYAGVDWVNYRGTDDGSTVAVATDEAKFFPVGAVDTFEVAWGPAEFMDTVNRPGVPILPKIVPDPSGRQAFVDIEVYSYPLFICKRPLTLRRATLST